MTSSCSSRVFTKAWVEYNDKTIDKACVRGFPMVPLVGNICTIGYTNLITNGTIGKEIGANGNMVQITFMLPTNGTIGRTPNTRKINLS